VRQADVLRAALTWIVEQLAFLAVVAVLAAAFLYLIVQSGHWGRSAGVISVAVLLAGLLRLVLPTRHAGLLAVRSRLLDAACYLALGGVILAVDIRLHA
jgi:Protein of unknown function (DUF3017)